jgi:general secretion pathway protein I
MRRPRGFTLLEVIVAMAIAATALVALFGAAGATSRNATVLRDRTYGQLVASNQLAELRARRAWPATGVLQGSSDIAGRTWAWRAQVSATDDAAIRRIDFSVSAEDGTTAATLIGFLGRPGGG